MRGVKSIPSKCERNQQGVESGIFTLPERESLQCPYGLCTSLYTLHLTVTRFGAILGNGGLLLLSMYGLAPYQFITRLTAH